MTSEEPGTTSGTRRRPAWVVGSIAAAVLLAGGGTAYWASAAQGDGGTARRTGDGAASAPREAGGPSGPGIAPGEPDPSGAGVVYRADVKLPEAPAAAPAYRVTGDVAEADVARLTAALGISGAPRLEGDVWLAGEAADGSGPRLTVARQAPGTWNFNRFQGGDPAGNGAGDDCVRGKDTCGPATLPRDAGGAGGSGKPVSEEAAKAAAGPVLAALGQGGAKLDARLTHGAVRVVAADPVLDGLPTQGWSTKVSVGADGSVVGGNGELKAPVRAGDQQVVGAVEALARLNARSGGGGGSPEPSGCASAVPPAVDTAAGDSQAVPCNPEPRPMKPPRTETVKGAVLGLAPGTVEGARGLVPAWLFEVAGQGGAPGHTVVEPASAKEGTPGPKDGRTVPGFSYKEADRKLTVNFWGSVCSTYALEAREQAESVMVKITDTPNKPGQACIMLAEERSLTVALREPLGDRKVLDATTGKPLAKQ
ncbi:hypothetical protein [Streptomyces sp. NRRL F-2664]|uniref:hypothetical protein n=1 Tax=Streptomyces sp. NRRL F-2664 TaxID=1463842 RepID=UPI0004CB0837|nr:hypothetical protein [Streptomyces sp. NRRL F-2664]